MEIERLVRMANDIAHFWQAEPDHEDAVAGISGHLVRFWDPRMRREIAAHAAGGGHGLEPLALEAVRRLPAQASAA